jgi:hypothetical protein
MELLVSLYSELLATAFFLIAAMAAFKKNLGVTRANVALVCAGQNRFIFNVLKFNSDLGLGGSLGNFNDGR